MISVNNPKGFTLIELVVVIVLIGIIATVATREVMKTIESAEYEHTKKEMQQIAWAVVGNPDIYSNGARSDFGYVGDVGALPPNLNALASNPGGYTTWNGPYLTGGFDATGYLQDAWKTNYAFTGISISSTGSGSAIDKIIANNSADLLSNTVKGNIVDADLERPGTTYKDSLILTLTYPDGSGAMTTSSIYPSARGAFSFSNIPIGNLTLSSIYLPLNDTLTIPVAVSPGKTVKMNVVFPADLW